MPTREYKLDRVLKEMAGEIPGLYWAALVDQEGLIVACFPNDPPVDQEAISAMTAATISLSDRVLADIDGGNLHYTAIIGSRCQHVSIVISKDRSLSIGLKPEVKVQSSFGPLCRWLPELSRVLHMRIS